MANATGATREIPFSVWQARTDADRSDLEQNRLLPSHRTRSEIDSARFGGKPHGKSVTWEKLPETVKPQPLEPEVVPYHVAFRPVSNPVGPFVAAPEVRGINRTLSDAARAGGHNPYAGLLPKAQPMGKVPQTSPEITPLPPMLPRAQRSRAAQPELYQCDPPPSGAKTIALHAALPLADASCILLAGFLIEQGFATHRHGEKLAGAAFASLGVALGLVSSTLSARAFSKSTLSTRCAHMARLLAGNTFLLGGICLVRHGLDMRSGGVMAAGLLTGVTPGVYWFVRFTLQIVAHLSARPHTIAAQRFAALGVAVGLPAMAVATYFEYVEGKGVVRVACQLAAALSSLSEVVAAVMLLCHRERSRRQVTVLSPPALV